MISKGGLLMALPQEPFYTLEDIYALPDGKRAELLDGQIYNMAPPSRVHQEIVQFMTKNIGYHIDKKNGSCKVYPAPFAVFLTKDNSNYVEPDVSVICEIGDETTVGFSKSGLHDANMHAIKAIIKKCFFIIILMF